MQVPENQTTARCDAGILARGDRWDESVFSCLVFVSSYVTKEKMSQEQSIVNLDCGRSAAYVTRSPVLLTSYFFINIDKNFWSV